MSKSAVSLLYKAHFVKPKQREQILQFLQSLYPIWEMRYSQNNPPPAGKTQRELLRPVYWLGNWQFACLNYYHPPKGILHRCVQAEAYPQALAAVVAQIEKIVQESVATKDIPKGWCLNTCLINYYGDRLEGEKAIDVARVGEHKDFEPGPVGSISFGERALIQFVESPHRNAKSRVVTQQWLEDSSLQVFAGDRFKKQLFHRVQRVEDKTGHTFALNTPRFRTRRINFTFRFVPPEHIQLFRNLPTPQKQDAQIYVENLARHSEFWESALKNSN